MKRIVLAAVAALAGLVVIAPTAAAHAQLSSTSPAAGDILDDAPDAIELRFTEPVVVDDDSVKVFDAGGRRVETGAPESVDGGREVVVALDDLDDGGYVTTWKVVSADGHPIGGGFTWRIGDSSTEVDPSVVDDLLAAQTTSRAVGIVAALDRFAVFAGLVVLIGGAAFVAGLWPAGAGRRVVRRVLWSSWAATLVATIVGIGLQAADVAGGGLADALDPSLIADVLDTTFGTAWLARVALLVPAAVLVWQLPRATQTWWRVGAVAAGAALLATPAFSGHADSGRWLALAKVVDVVHLGAGALWLGGLAVLLTAGLRVGDNEVEARALTARFSPVAFAAVAVVVVTGTVQSVRQVTTLDALETSYGRLLAIKIVIVLALIGVASLTRSALHGRLELDRPGRPDRSEVSVLRRLVAAEVALAVVVLGVTSLLVDANPSDAVADAGGPFDETQVVGDVLINVVVVPGTVGPTDIHVYVDDPAGGLEPPVGITGTLALPSGGIEGVDVPFVTAGPSHWSANDVDVPIAGRWELTLDILLTDVDEVSSTFTIPIGGAT